MGIRISDKDSVADSAIKNSDTWIGAELNNNNVKIPPSQIRMQAVAVCNIAGATAAKTGTVNNMPDFVLKNGLFVTVYFQYGNTVANPTFNLNGTGSYPMRCENQASSVSIGSGAWVDGAILTLQYVEVSSSAKYWLIVGHSVAATDTSTSGKITNSNGTAFLTNTQINSALANYHQAKTMASGTDLNTLTSTCLWSIPNSTVAKSLINSPYTNLSFMLEVEYMTSTRVRQVATTFSGLSQTRYYADGTWSSWISADASTVVSNALVDLESFPLNSNITDYNDAFVNGKTTRYSLSASLTNAPDSVGAYMVESISSPNSLSSNYYGYQIAKRVGNNISECTYIRTKIGASTWTAWVQIATNSDLADKCKSISLTKDSISINMAVTGGYRSSTVQYAVTYNSNYNYYAEVTNQLGNIEVTFMRTNSDSSGYITFIYKCPVSCTITDVETMITCIKKEN